MTADIAVIGAGIIGASVSWRLAHAGLRVTLFDAGRFGSEASWAGAGMLAPGGEMDRPSVWTDLALESLKLYPGFVADLEQESGLPIDYQRHGAIEIARNEQEWEALRVRAAAQRGFGIPSEELHRSEMRELAPLVTADFAGALYFPQDSLVNPRNILLALRVICDRRRVRLHEARRVTSLHVTGSEVRLDTESGPVNAGGAVLAAGAWSSQIALLADGAAKPLPPSFPVRGHLLGYRLETASLHPIVRCGHTYVLQRAGGYTIAGASSERVGYSRDIDPAIVEDLHRQAAGLVPSLLTAPRPDVWVGFRPATGEEGPVMGRVGALPVWLCYGHYRNGILLAPAAARHIADSIVAA